MGLPILMYNVQLLMQACNTSRQNGDPACPTPSWWLSHTGKTTGTTVYCDTLYFVNVVTLITFVTSVSYVPLLVLATLTIMRRGIGCIQ